MSVGCSIALFDCEETTSKRSCETNSQQHKKCPHDVARAPLALLAGRSRRLPDAAHAAPVALSGGSACSAPSRKSQLIITRRACSGLYHA